MSSSMQSGLRCRRLHRGASSGRYWSEGRIARCPRSAATALARNDRQHAEIDRPIDHGEADAEGEALVRRGRCEAASIGVDAGADRDRTLLASDVPTYRRGHRAANPPWIGSRSVCGREIDLRFGIERLGAA